MPAGVGGISSSAVALCSSEEGERCRLRLPPPGASGVRGSLLGCNNLSIMAEGREGASGFANTGNNPSWKMSSETECLISSIQIGSSIIARNLTFLKIGF